MITACCVCDRIKCGDEWVVSDINPSKMTDISHGYCPECFEEVMKQLEEYVSGQLLVAAASKLTVNATA